MDMFTAAPQLKRNEIREELTVPCLAPCVILHPTIITMRDNDDLRYQKMENTKHATSSNQLTLKGLTRA